MRATFEIAIENNPQDWTTHKVFADWLNENDCPEEADFHRFLNEDQWIEANAWFSEQCEKINEHHVLSYGDLDSDVFHPWKLIQVGARMLVGEEGHGFYGNSEVLDELRTGDWWEEYWRQWQIITGKYLGDPEDQPKFGFHCAC